MTDLFSMTDTKEDLSFIIEANLKRRFAKKHNSLKLPNNHDETAALIVCEYENRISFIDSQDFDFSNIITKFGHLLTNLEITYSACSFAENQIPTFFQRINSHCSETLTELGLSFTDVHNIFEQFKKPFMNLKLLKLEEVFGDLNNEHLKFTEMFPALTQLTLKYFKPESPSWMEQTFPNLMHLDTVINFSDMGMNEKNFRKFIKNNAQMNKLNLLIHTTSKSLDLLQFIAEQLPQLEHLQLREYNEDNDNANLDINIHFEHLKTLIVQSFHFELPSRTTYGRLEEVQISQLFSQNSYKWIQLVKNQKSLRKLTVNQYLNDADVVQMANAQSNLIEITFECCCRLWRQTYHRSLNEFTNCSCSGKVTNIIRLIEMSKDLMELHLHVGWAATNSIFQTMQNQLPSGWTVHRQTDELNGDCVYFKRF